MNNGRKFDWDSNKLNDFIKETENDKAVQISMRIIDKYKQRTGTEPHILEAGCGNGRVIAYLDINGYKNLHGIELNKDAVENFKSLWPHLDVRYGDIMNLPNDLKNHNIVLSYGVVEHFTDGPSRPLKQMYTDLNDNGLAIITVPILNRHRYKQYKKSRHPEKIWDKKTYPYYPLIVNDEFFEYRFKLTEFQTECKNAGFKIIKSFPTGLEWGILEILNPQNKLGHFIWVGNDMLHFHYTKMGRILFNIIKLFPRYCAHMWLFVCKK